MFKLILIRFFSNFDPQVREYKLLRYFSSAYTCNICCQNIVVTMCHPRRKPSAPPAVDYKACIPARSSSPSRPGHSL